MTMYYLIYQPLSGGTNGQYRPTAPTTSGGPTDAAGGTNLGTGSGFAAGQNAYGPTHPTVEDAGIRAGEIIAYRAWFVGHNLLLHSVVMTYCWTPGAIEQAYDVDAWSPRGFYAFKDNDLLLCDPGFLFSPPVGSALVIGEVQLWGTVIEHENGYRAEYAKIHKLTALYGSSAIRRWLKFWRPSLLDVLRKKYGVE